jgi:hypothetical protein
LLLGYFVNTGTAGAVISLLRPFFFASECRARGWGGGPAFVADVHLRMPSLLALAGQMLAENGCESI